jgi:hypothetical protein
MYDANELFRCKLLFLSVGQLGVWQERSIFLLTYQSCRAGAGFSILIYSLETSTIGQVPASIVPVKHSFDARAVHI